MAATSFRDFEHQGWSSEDVAVGYHDYLSPITTQAIEALLDAAGVKHGTRVVDVARGAGYAAGAAAERGAVATGVDFSATQLTLARQRYLVDRVPRRGRRCTTVRGRQLRRCYQQLWYAACARPGRLHPRGLSRPSKWWPVCFQRLGIARGIRRPRHRLPCRSDPWLLDVPLPPGPSFFLFSDPGQCKQSLHTAGFQSATVSTVPQIWRVASPDVPFEAIMKGTVRAAALLRAQTPEALVAIRDAARRAASSYERDGVIELMMPAVVAAAGKP